jgi:hypothetical protein
VNEHNELVENDVVRRLMWAGLVTVIGALASLVAQRGAEAIWIRVFDEEPPE